MLLIGGIFSFLHLRGALRISTMEGPLQYILFINYFLSWPEANLTADLDEKRYIVLAYLTKVKKAF